MLIQRANERSWEEPHQHPDWKFTPLAADPVASSPAAPDVAPKAAEAARSTTPMSTGVTPVVGPATDTDADANANELSVEEAVFHVLWKRGVVEHYKSIADNQTNSSRARHVDLTSLYLVSIRLCVF